MQIIFQLDGRLIFKIYQTVTNYWRANHYTPQAYPINPSNPALRGLGGYLAADWRLTALFAAIRL